MSFGAPGSEGARVDNVKDLEAVMDLLLKHGHREVRALFFRSIVRSAGA
jgi:aflatoxin B1 aldehyde reductase